MRATSFGCITWLCLECVSSVQIISYWAYTVTSDVLRVDCKSVNKAFYRLGRLPLLGFRLIGRLRIVHLLADGLTFQTQDQTGLRPPRPPRHPRAAANGEKYFKILPLDRMETDKAAKTSPPNLRRTSNAKSPHGRTPCEPLAVGKALISLRLFQRTLFARRASPSARAGLSSSSFALIKNASRPPR